MGIIEIHQTISSNSANAISGTGTRVHCAYATTRETISCGGPILVSCALCITDRRASIFGGATYDTHGPSVGSRYQAEACLLHRTVLVL